jgi:CheY-like chemotaxis protein
MVNQIIDETVAYFKNLLKKQEYKNIEIRVKKGNENNNFTIITDPLRFKQVMNNLVGNAIKFTDKGYVEIGYQIRTDNVLQFYIEDTGIGLPPDKMNVIFERFRQAEESSTKEYGGTGLGLTISRRLIELLGGTIWVESILHEGSTFYFTLPLIIANDAQIIKPFAKQTEINKMTGKFILVAEDENSNFELIKAMLQSTRANIIRANNGKEAIEICRKNNNISLILMDIRMPEMNGYIATKLIKEFKPSLPVISLTAYAMADDREKSIQAGCDDYISKPINPQELLEKIMKLIT